MKNLENKKLIDFFKEVPEDREFLIGGKQTFSYGEIVTFSRQLVEEFGFLKNKRLAIRFDEQFLACLYLPALELLGSLVFLLPEIDEEKVVLDFCNRAEIDFLLHINERLSYQEFDRTAEENGQVGWMLSTSGTTAMPKLVSYSMSDLIARLKNDLSRGKDVTWGLVYDVNRFAGLQVYLQAIMGGSRLVVPNNKNNIENLMLDLIKFKVNAISGTASFFRKILMLKNISSIPLSQITLGGEIADQLVLDLLKKYFPAARVIHIYASTEAGVGFSVSDGREGFPVSFLDSGYIKVKNNTLWIKIKNKRKKSLPDSIEIDEEGFLNTEDIVSLKSDRYLFIGRASGAINVGGNKVMPEEVERVIAQCNDILDCVVYGQKNALIGSVVCADIVLKDSSLTISNVKKEIIQICRKQLEPYKVPVLIKEVKTLVYNSSGKKNRR